MKTAEFEKENIFGRIKDYWNSDMKEKVEFEIKLLISKFQKEKDFLGKENRKLKSLVNLKCGLDIKSRTIDEAEFEKYRVKAETGQAKKSGSLF